MRYLLIALLSLMSINVQADNRFTLYGGANISGSSNYTVPDSGTGFRSGTQSSKIGPSYGAEYTYQTPGLFGLSAIIENTPYKNQDGSTDSLTSFMVGPRAEWSPSIVGSRLHLWGEFAVGGVLNYFESSATTIGSTFVALNNANNVTLVFSPRIGADFQLTDTVFIGLQAEYSQTSQTMNEYNEPSAGGSQTPVSQSYTRHWITTAVRVGFNF